MANFVSNNTEIFIGPWTNYGRVDRPGWARYFTSASTYDNVSFVEHMGYNTDWRGWVLSPLHSYDYITDMNLSDFTITTGEFDLCQPVGSRKKYIHAYNTAVNATPNNELTRIVCNNSLSANPKFTMNFMRTSTPPYGQDVETIEYRLYFGVDMYLHWGADIPPTLYFPINNYVQATLTTNTGVNYADIVYTAKPQGVAGNDVTIEYRPQETPDSPLSVAVYDSAIVVFLASDLNGDPRSTAGDIVAAINAYTPAKHLVAMQLVDDGSGVPSSYGPVALTGGTTTQTQKKDVYHVQKGEAANYAQATYIDFSITCLEGDIIIKMSCFNKPWVIRDVGDVPSAPYTITSRGQAYAFNLLEARYENTGYFITDWIDTRDPLWTGDAYDEGVQAELTTDMADANADVTYRSVGYGDEENTISITYTSPGTPSQPISVSVVGRAITVSLATNELSQTVTTGTEIMNAVNVSVDASALVTATLPNTSTGSGIATAMAATYLAGATTLFGWQVWPSAPDGTSVQVSIEDVDGYKKKYRVTLAGNGDENLGEPSTQTPILQGWQVMYAPRDADVPTPQWDDITPWFAGGSEQLGLETTSRSTTITLRPYKLATGDQNLFDAIGWDLRGNFAVYYRTGYSYDDGSSDSIVRMYGLAKSRAEHPFASSDKTFSLSVFDRGATLRDFELHHAPCLLGMTVGDAMSTLAHFGGIPLSDIEVHAGLTDTLKDPGKQYDRPRFLVKDGSTVGSMMSQLNDLYDVVAEFQSDGKLHIYRPLDHPESNEEELVRAIFVNTSYQSKYDWDRFGYTPVHDLTMSTDQAGAENVILVKGYPIKRWDKDDNRLVGYPADYEMEPIYTVAIDTESVTDMGTDRYLGHYAIKTITNNDIHTEEGLQDIADLAFQRRKGGWPMMTFKTTDAWWLEPRMFVRVIDAFGVGDYLCRIDNISNEMKLGVYNGTVTARVLGAYIDFFPNA